VWPEISCTRVIGIEEKPAKAQTYPRRERSLGVRASVFDEIRTLVPSRRGELKITNVNDAYIREDTLTLSHHSQQLQRHIRAAPSIKGHAIDRFVHVSTDEVYGTTRGTVLRPIGQTIAVFGSVSHF
jgi:dTDP-glucose pyrophosphorylase